MSEIDAAELDDFCTKLEQFMNTLSEPQQALLNGILKIAWNATEREESLQESLEEGFNGSFSPGQAELILAYHPSGPVVAISRLIRSHHGLIRSHP
jgi:hypothetical protein